MNAYTAIRESIELYEWLEKHQTKNPAYYFRHINQKIYVNNDPLCQYVVDNFPINSFSPDCRHCLVWPLEGGKDPLTSSPRCIRDGNSLCDFLYGDIKARRKCIQKILEDLREIENAQSWDKIAEVWEIGREE